MPNPLNIANRLLANKVNIIGTDPHSIDLAENRKIWESIKKLNIPAPKYGTAFSIQDAIQIAMISNILCWSGLLMY